MKKLCLKLGLLSLALFACFGLSHIAKAFSESDIVSYYTFDGSGGSTLGDNYIVAGPDFSTGLYDATTTAKFSGALAGPATNGSTSYLDLTSSFTISFWYKTGSITTETNIITLHDNSSLRLQFRNGGTIDFVHQDSSGWAGFTTPETPIVQDNAWHNYIIQGTWGSMTTTFKVFVDGVDAGISWDTRDQTTVVGGTAKAGINVDNSLENNKNYHPIDDLAFFNILLSTDEIGYLQDMTVADAIDYIPTPASGDYLLYYGDYFSYTPTNSNFDLPIVYDVCASYGTSTADLYFVPTSDVLMLPDQQLFNCSGVVRYNQPSGDTEINEDAYFQIYTYPDYTVLATSSIFSLTVYDPIISGTYIVNDSSDTFLVDTYPSAGTSTINFHYDVCNDSAYVSGDKIYLNNRDNNALTSFYRTITTCSGTSSIDITYPKNFYWYFNADLSYENSSSTISVVSEPFIVGFSPITKPFNASSSAMFDLSAHEMACSDSEWIDAASSTAWFNWTKIKCSSFETVLDIVFTISDIPKIAASSMISVLKISFPFNLPVKVYESYQNSTSSLPVALSYFNIADDNGNMFITMPAQWDPSGTSTQYIVFGSEVLSPSNTPEGNFFAGIRAFSTYIIWFMFVFFVINKIISIKEHLTGEVEGDFIQTGMSYNSKGEMSTTWKPRGE